MTLVNLIYLGPPGVGKGTHAERSAQYLKIPKISTGDMIRHEIEAGRETEFGVKLKRYHDGGLLVSDGIVLDILMERIDLHKDQKGFILDGVPRTLSQAKALEKLLAERNQGIDFVFYLNASDDILFERLKGRMTCKACERIYHIKFQPPEVEWICDTCGGELYIRDDQTDDAIRNRLHEYREKTKPVIKYYVNTNTFYEMNAESEISDVQERIIRLLSEKGYI